MQARVIEHAELIFGKAIEILAAEPGSVQVDLVKYLEVKITGQTAAVLRVVAPAHAVRRLGRPGRRGRSPRLPGRAVKPGAVQHQAVAAAAIFPGRAEAIGDRARGHVERVRCRGVADESV